MIRFRLVHFVLLALCFLGGHPTANRSEAADRPGAFAVVKVRFFDGARMVPRGTVVVNGGRIVAAGPKVRPPRGAEVIDGAGATLLPGFIDAHSHTYGPALERALVFGVTTELDMFADPEAMRFLREEQAATGAPERADVRSAGFLATTAGGHGTQYGLPVPTLAGPGEAQAWVDARLAEGSDYIKIVSEDGAAYGRERPALDHATIAALIQAAHRRRRLAVVHVSTQERARAAVEAGADGLVHIFADEEPEPGFAPLLARRKTFVVPTLSVSESTTGVASGESLTVDARLAPFLTPGEVTNLRQSFIARPEAPNRLEHAFAAVRRLRAARVRILAGSDAPNPGTTHGASIHREMELLVQAGLTPLEALTAATSAPAKAFGLTDRGRIARGLRADLVLVRGNPRQDITATRDILRIWKGGHPVERLPAP
ncbi:MAG TPA: amidohydrolase family protein [Thermoanaerobaculia bacterium]|nr:amidohydrolase family protein [Thermoanaerobaculia bacterium]